MAKRYYLGERAVKALDKALPYINQQMRTTRLDKRTGTPLFGGRAILARITSAGPNEELDFTDARYWIREVIVTNEDNDYTSELTFAYPEKPEDLDMEDWRQITHWTVATNLFEFESEAHSLSTNDDVFVVVNIKGDQDSLSRFYFSQPNPQTLRPGQIKDVFPVIGPPSAHLYGGIYLDNVYEGWGGYIPTRPTASPSPSPVPSGSSPSSSPSDSAATEEEGLLCLERHDNNIVYLSMGIEDYVEVIFSQDLETGVWSPEGIFGGEAPDFILP